MNFNQAFEMVEQIHQQCGDHMSWKNLKSYLREEAKRYKTGKSMMSDLYRRSDLSQDQCWIFEEMDESIKVLFALLNPNEDHSP